MSKKHFIALADSIIDYNTDAPNIGHTPFNGRQLELLAAFCGQQNPRFDRERWLGYIQGTNGPSGGRV